MVLEGAAVVTVVVRTVVKSYSATSKVPNQSAICIRLYYNGYLADELFDLDLLGEKDAMASPTTPTPYSGYETE